LTLLDEHWANTQCWQLVADGLNAVVSSRSSTDESKKITGSDVTLLVYRIVRWVVRLRSSFFGN
jgi:hypothetical protein